jgi:hypothetical protein
MMPRRQGLIEHAADLIRGWHFDAAYALLHPVVTDPVALDALPPVRRATLRRLYNDVLRERGDLALALHLGDRLLADCRRQLGDNHPATLRAMLSVAATQFLAGDHTAAKPTFSVVAAHPLTTIVSGLTKEAIIARAYLTLHTANPIGKADWLAAVLRDCRLIFGPSDPCTIRITIELAHLHATIGNRDAATGLLAAARTGAITSGGADSRLVRQLEYAIHSINHPAGESANTTNPPAHVAPCWTGPASRRRVRKRRAIHTTFGLTIAIACLACVAMLTVATTDTRAVPVTWITGQADLRPRELRVHTADDAVTVTWNTPHGVTDPITPHSRDHHRRPDPNQPRPAAWRDQPHRPRPDWRDRVRHRHPRSRGRADRNRRQLCAGGPMNTTGAIATFQGMAGR